MSNYVRLVFHPKTGERERAEFLDDYFGSHIYGVRFKSGEVFYQHEVTTVESKDETTDYRKGFVEGQSGERDAYLLFTGCTDLDEYNRGFLDGQREQEDE